MKQAIADLVLDATGEDTPTPLLWDFRCEAQRLPNGHYRVRITGTKSGEVRERTGYHPLWELIRLIGLKTKRRRRMSTTGIDSITITIHRPPLVIRPNGRTLNHRWKHAEIAKYRRTASIIALAALGSRPAPRWPTARVEIVYVGGRRMDPDNAIASLKAAIDGIVDAGVMSGDRDPEYAPIGYEPALKSGEAKRRYLIGGGHHVRITVRKGGGER